MEAREIWGVKPPSLPANIRVYAYLREASFAKAQSLWLGLPRIKEKKGGGHLE